MKYQYGIIMTVGVLVILLPLLRVPAAWDAVIHVILGIVLITTGLVIHQYISRRSQPSSTESSSDTLTTTGPASFVSSSMGRVRKLFVRE